MWAVCLFACAMVGGKSTAQEDSTLWASLSESDWEAINALVLYPEPVRNHILELCTAPAVILRLDQIQQQTREEFQDLIGTEEEHIQKDWYELARFPDLVHQLAREDRPSRSEIEAWLTDYPESVHEPALRLGREEHRRVRALDALNSRIDEQVADWVRTYPRPTQEAVAALMGYPEVLEILTTHIETAILVGDHYRRDPSGTLARADALHLEAARKNAEELEGWKQELEENPEARTELETAAQAYAEEEYGNPPVYKTPEEVHVYHHDYRPYPYWYGYPWWYGVPYWYPRSFWYDWGFYFGPNRTLVVFSLPSLRFTNWYFYYHRHHYYYPHLSHLYLLHYERHPASYFATTLYVRRWSVVQTQRLARDWLANDGRRVERFREYGRFEDDYQRYVAARRPDGKTLVLREEYLARNRRDYPTLEEAKVLRRPDGTRVIEEIDPVYRSPSAERRVRETEEPRRLPKVRTPERPSPAPETTRSPATPPVRKAEPRAGKTLENAREYHREIWDKEARPQPRTRAGTPTPQTQTVPRTPATRKPATKAPASPKKPEPPRRRP